MSIPALNKREATEIALRAQELATVGNTVLGTIARRLTYEYETMGLGDWDNLITCLDGIKERAIELRELAEAVREPMMSPHWGTPNWK